MDEWFAVESDPRTPAEAAFLNEVRNLADGLALAGVRKPDTQCWLFEDDQGIWMMLHLDLASDDTVLDVLRVDYGDGAIVGGRSPGMLNWDAERRYVDCGVDLADPTMLGIREEGPPEVLARSVTAWFVESARSLARLRGQN
ncbi:hypothetical protein AB0M47_26305 [Hamadaea sp. NPDC051192]|uniref:hypothetical protein n=1 Tax=Hamadaea sp. NPDC051192 TaxID=3154940 RepID=UPI003436D99C